jgi:C4-dicarboxylate transporter DctM subunit
LDPMQIGMLGMIALFALIVLKVPIAFSMLAVGVTFFAMETSWGPALTLLANEPAGRLSSVDLASMPLFLLMGTFASAAGFSEDLYAAAAAFLGHRKGGLAYATLGGSAAFGSICGSSTATAATFAKVALPEMLRRGYAPSFASGTIAAGGTLKSLIPPAIVMIIYAIATKTFIYDLFAAAIVPAIITIGLNFLAIAITVRLYPHVAPLGERVPWPERIAALKRAIPGLVLIVLVFVGFYSGLFTISEAASMAAVLAFLFALVMRRLTWRNLASGFTNAAGVTAMVYGVVFGSDVFTYFLTSARVPDLVVEYITHLPLPPLAIIVAILVFYIVLGAVFDEFAAMLITLPFILPVIIQLGYDAVWWGIINVIIIELGLIVPPIGFIVFLIHGMAPQISLATIYRGVTPFIFADISVLAAITVFPGLTLWLPHLLNW